MCTYSTHTHFKIHLTAPSYCAQPSIWHTYVSYCWETQCLTETHAQPNLKRSWGNNTGQGHKQANRSTSYLRREGHSITREGQIGSRREKRKGEKERGEVNVSHGQLYKSNALNFNREFSQQLLLDFKICNIHYISLPETAERHIYRLTFPFLC